MTPTMETVLFAAGLAILAASWWRRRQTRWTRKLRLSGAHGTVYVMQDRTEPELVKVGVTTRLSRERKAEIVRTMTAGAPLRQLLALDLPHARSVETVAHRRLHRHRHHGERGRECYHAATPAKLERILTEVENAARDVKRLAQRQGAWSQEDEDDAYRWRLTIGLCPIPRRDVSKADTSGPTRTPLFRPKTPPPAFGQSAAPATPNPP